jgi:hypothetical protein
LRKMDLHQKRLGLFVCLVCLLARSNTALQQGDITSVPGGKAAFWDSSKQSTYSPAPATPVRAVPLAASRHRAASSHAAHAIQGHVSCRPDRRLIDEPDG